MTDSPQKNKPDDLKQHGQENKHRQEQKPEAEREICLLTVVDLADPSISSRSAISDKAVQAQPGDKTGPVKVADKAGDIPEKLSAAESNRLTKQQQFILAELNKLQSNPALGEVVKQLEALRKGVEDDMKGIVRDKDGNIVINLGYPVHGANTKLATAEIKDYLNQSTKQGLEALAKAKAPMHPYGPPVPLYEHGPQKGYVRSAEALLKETENGHVHSRFNFDPNNILSQGDLYQLYANREFRRRCDDTLENVKTNRLAEIARREIARNGYSWSVNTPEQAIAAMFVLESYRQTANLIESIQSMAEKIGEPSTLDRYISPENKREWLEQINPEKLSKFGCEILREGNRPDGKIVSISFKHPKELNVLSPEFRQQLKEMKDWNEKSKGSLAQLMDEYRQTKIDNRRILISGEHEIPGWVRQSGDKSKPYEVVMKYDENGKERSRPPGEGWAYFNLKDRHIGVEEIRDKAGNLEGVKLTATIDYCDVPPFSYLNMYKPHARTEVMGKDTEIQTEKIELGEFKPDEKVFVLSNGAIEYLPSKDLTEFVSRQEFWQLAGKGTTATMDLSIILGVSAAATGRRAARMALREAEGRLAPEIARAAASSARESETVFGMLEKAAKDKTLPDAAQLLTKLRSDPLTMTQAMRELALQGRRLASQSNLGWLTGGGGLLNNAGAKDTPGLSQLNTTRGLYFLTTIGKGTIIDPLISGFNKLTQAEQTVPLAQRLLSAVTKTEATPIRALGEMGHVGFMSSQIPFATMQIAHLSRQIEDLAQTGIADPMHVSIVRMLESAQHQYKVGAAKLLYPEHRNDKQYQMVETAVQFLDNYKKSLGVAGSKSAAIDEIIDGTKKFLSPPWKLPGFAGPVSAKEEAEFEAAKQKFIENTLIPHLLSSGKDIQRCESDRAATMIATGQEEKLNNKKNLTAEEVREQDFNEKLKPYDQTMRSAAAVALLWLGKGSKTYLDKKTGMPDPEIIFGRKISVPAWEEVKRYDKEGLPVSKIISPEHEILQEIKIEDLTNILEKDLLASSNSSVLQRIYTGEILVSAGVPGEVYGSVLKEIITSKKVTDNEKNQAIANLGLVMVGLHESEFRRTRQLTPDSLRISQGLSSGLSSSELHNFLVNLSKDKSQDLNQRALASYMAQAYGSNRLTMNGDDIAKLKEITSRQPGHYSYNEFYNDMTKAAFEQNPITVADWRRKFQAALALRDFCNEEGNLISPISSGPEAANRYGLKDINKSIADCTKSALVGEQEAQKLREQIIIARKEVEAKLDQNRMPPSQRSQMLSQAIKNDAKLQKLTLEWQNAETRRLLTFDLSIKCRDELLKPASNSDEPGLYQMDKSDYAEERQAALQARQNLLQLLKTPCIELEDVKIKTELIGKLQPLLQDKHITGNNRAIKETVAKKRIEVIHALEATLVPKLLDAKSTEGKAAIASAKENHPGVKEAADKYSQLYVYSQLRSEFREAAIKVLANMNVRDAQQLIKEKIYVENEADPDVRLAAVQAYRHLASPVEFTRTAEDLRNRKADDPNHPAERDPAIVLALQQGHTSGEAGISPDTLAYRERMDDIRSRINPVDLDKLLERDTIKSMATSNSEYNWLFNLRDKVLAAKAEAYGFTIGGYGRTATGLIDSTLDSWRNWPFGQNAANDRERAAQETVVKEYLDNFNDLKTTAFEGNGIERTNARQILYWLATSDGALWDRTERTDADLQAAGQSNANLFIDKKFFAKLQLEAASTLANCYSKDIASRKTTTSDSGLALLEKILQKGLLDANAPSDCKIQFMRGLFAASSARENNIAGRITAGKPSAARSSGENIETVMQALDKVKNEPAETQLALQMIAYLRQYTTDKSVYSKLEGIANANEDQAGSYKVAPIVANAARDALANIRDSALTIRELLSSDESSDGNIREQHTRLLDEAVAAAGKFIINGNPAPGRDEGRDELQEKQAKEDTLAIHNIFAATKDVPITKVDDPRAVGLTQLLDVQYNETVRMAAATALMKDSTVPELQAMAIQLMAEQAIYSNRYGVRRDAQLNIDQLNRKEQLAACEQAFETVRNNLLTQMKAELPSSAQSEKAESLGNFVTRDHTEEQILSEFQRLHKGDTKLETYAACLDNLAAMKLKIKDKLSPEDAMEIRALLEGSLNLYRGKPPTTPLPNLIRLESELKQNQLDKEHFPSIARCVSDLGQYYERTGSLEKANNRYLLGLRLLYASVGAKHSSTQASIREYNAFIERHKH